MTAFYAIIIKVAYWSNCPHYFWSVQIQLFFTKCRVPRLYKLFFAMLERTYFQKIFEMCGWIISFSAMGLWFDIMMIILFSYTHVQSVCSRMKANQKMKTSIALRFLVFLMKRILRKLKTFCFQVPVQTIDKFFWTLHFLLLRKILVLINNMNLHFFWNVGKRRVSLESVVFQTMEF